MRKVFITLLSLAVISETVGCGAKEDNNTTITGGADGPTSVFVASKADEEKIDYADPIDESIYYQVMDRILSRYNFDALDWGSEVNMKDGTDALISWAEDSTGRYKAFGVISKDAGCYGIILDDTIDGTDNNANYVYEEWAYTGNAEDKPTFEWTDDRLYLSYPVLEADKICMKTVKIDHGYDTGHMGFDRFYNSKDSDTSDAMALIIPGTWQTASIGYVDGGDMQPEYYVQFTETEVDYGHMKDGAFSLDHSDKIFEIEKTAKGEYQVKAESANGVQYTYRTAESDTDVLEYYETWNEDDFSEMYRGGASLTIAITK